MNSVLATSPFSAPHLLQNRHSPTRSMLSTPSNMASRKRKADDDAQDHDERMSASPSNSPSIHPRSLPQHGNRNTKRMRTNVTGRPLDLPRLLETLSPDDMRGLLTSICERHPEIGAEVVNTAPRPSISSAIQVLGNYESALQASFPFGNRNSSDYAYNRVRQALSNLIEALKDYTPHFLPPNEDQAATSLSYLDSATEVIHRLPNWETYQHNRLKQDAYDDIAKAWALVVKEAAKRGGGIQLQYGGWDQKIAKHNELSGGKMQEAVNELQSHLGWMAGGSAGSEGAQTNDPASIRQQLLNGTYGAGMPVRVGPW
ncbi:Cut8-domain-containing protein [Saccharata proteae CBS 121410]|uniref:Tethering factor for nuclear proteasome STS1 n=1 Tax=Saccharata proteae CBS 121410 TaxID=1314787 RepID=A0A9P4LYM4_9PEZI|nr:Cut8-domain-containing protein [Saccharata proteae CBS 121410]